MPRLMATTGRTLAPSSTSPRWSAEPAAWTLPPGTAPSSCCARSSAASASRVDRLLRRGPGRPLSGPRRGSTCAGWNGPSPSRSKIHDEIFRAMSQGTLGSLELVRRRPVRRGCAATAAAALADRPRLDQLSIWPCWPDAIEALVALGETDLAREYLEAYDQRARATGSPWVLATAARCDGLLHLAAGDVDAGLRALRARAGRASTLAVPVPDDPHAPALRRGLAARQAAPRCAGGARLGAATRRRDRGTAPRRARAGGARPGQRPRSPGDGALTSTEQRIAALVARGQDQQAGRRRALPHARTVEGNLTRIYTKLGVRSRTELARRFSDLGRVRRGNAAPRSRRAGKSTTSRIERRARQQHQRARSMPRPSRRSAACRSAALRRSRRRAGAPPASPARPHRACSSKRASCIVGVVQLASSRWRSPCRRRTPRSARRSDGSSGHAAAPAARARPGSRPGTSARRGAARRSATARGRRAAPSVVSRAAASTPSRVERGAQPRRRRAGPSNGSTPQCLGDAPRPAACARQGGARSIVCALRGSITRRAERLLRARAATSSSVRRMASS